MTYDFSKLEKRLLDYVNVKHDVSGLTLAILKDGKELFRKNIGYLNLEKGYLVSDRSYFRLASMTKPITGVAILICKDRGLLSLDDYIDKYIPILNEFYVRDINGQLVDKKPYRLKIEWLLRHSSGLQSGPLGEKESKQFVKEQFISLEKSMELYKNTSLEYVPGSKETYSPTLAYDILARIVEIVSGMDYYSFLKKNIFDPLNMSHTTYDINKVKEEDLVVNYKKENDKLVSPDLSEPGFEYFPNNYPGGGAGLISTLDDYIKFAEMLRKGGVYGNNKRLISKESFQEMLKHDEKSETKVFGLSLHVRSGYEWEHLPASFFGWSGAYGTHFFCSQKYGITVVYLHNSKTFGGDDGSHIFKLEDDICDIFKLKNN